MSWRTLLQIAAVAGVVEAALIMGIVEKALVPPALILAILLLVGAVLLRGAARAGVWITTVAVGLFLVANLIFSLPDLFVPASFWTFAVTWLAVATGLVGLIAGIATWRDRTVSVAAPRIGLAGIGVGVLAIVIGLVASLGFSNAKPASGDIAEKAQGSKFKQPTLAATNGQVTFFLDNADNTLHNFHIVGVKGGTKNMPANHKTRFTVALAPGTYKFQCDFHNNMKGTITVR